MTNELKYTKALEIITHFVNICSNINGFRTPEADIINSLSSKIKEAQTFLQSSKEPMQPNICPECLTPGGEHEWECKFINRTKGGYNGSEEMLEV